MSAPEALLKTFAVFAVLFLIAWAVLRFVDSRRRPSGPRGLNITVAEKLVLGGMIVTVLPLAILEYAVASFSPLVILAILLPPVAVMLHFFARGNRIMRSYLETIADQFGWNPNEFRRKKFTTLPEELVVRGWRGRRVGLTVVEPSPHGPGFLKVTLQLEGDSTRVIFPASASEGHLDQPDKLFAPLVHSADSVNVKLGRVETRLALTNRPSHLGGPPVFSYSITSPQFEPLVRLAKQAWGITEAVALRLQGNEEPRNRGQRSAGQPN